MLKKTLPLSLDSLLKEGLSDFRITLLMVAEIRLSMITTPILLNMGLVLRNAHMRILLTIRVSTKVRLSL